MSGGDECTTGGFGLMMFSIGLGGVTGVGGFGAFGGEGARFDGGGAYAFDVGLIGGPVTVASDRLFG